MSGPGDTTPPTTHATVLGVAGRAGFYRTPVTVVFRATDPDDAPTTLTTSYQVNGGPVVDAKSVRLAANGVFRVTYHSTDPAGNVEATHTLLVRVDHSAPVISVHASPTTLWPPNNKLVPVLVRGHVSDTGSGVYPAVWYHVYDEYHRDQPGGVVPVNARGDYGFVVYLQASRLGQDRDGRHYVIFVTADDRAGNLRTAAAVVTVPHDMGHRPGPPSHGPRPVVIAGPIGFLKPGKGHGKKA